MSEIEVRFMKDAAGINLADDPKLALVATCIISQQAAGFKDKKGPVVDLRESECPTCKAPGYNTGWGYWKHICGAEVLSDGEESEPCGASVK